MVFEELKEFEKDLKQLLKKYRILNEATEKVI
jgi:mRNA-degrading endonuclease YafQ of YafQ-DinJ toxin-antitoxin module